jgi:hypothetical protein
MAEEQVIWKPGQEVTLELGDCAVCVPPSPIQPDQLRRKARIWNSFTIVLLAPLFVMHYYAGLGVNSQAFGCASLLLFLFICLWFWAGQRRYLPFEPVLNLVSKEILVATEGNTMARRIKRVLALQVVPIFVEPGRWWALQPARFLASPVHDRTQEQYQLNVLTDDPEKPRISWVIHPELGHVRELADSCARAMQVPVIDQIPVPRGEGDFARA